MTVPINDLDSIYIKIEDYVIYVTQQDAIGVAGTIMELCESRDSGLSHFADGNGFAV